LGEEKEMKRKPYRVALFAALLAALAMCAVPAVSSAATRTDKNQNKRLARQAKSIKKVSNALTQLAGAFTDGSKGLDGRIKTIEDAAPVIVNGLTQLADAAQKLKDGLTQAGAGLTKLGDAYQSVEYGRVNVVPGDSDLTVAAGGSGTSADIPDDGNAASIDDDAIIVAGAGATTETLDLRALIRSAESDGDDAGKTAGQAGGFLQLSNADTGAKVACTGAPNPPGILGTAPGATIQTPTGPVTNLPLKNVPGGFLRTDTTEPTGSNGISLFPGALPLCSFTATPGTTYKAHWSVQFLDIPTSTTPGPTE
jgi:X-X-X-Leu-X-X-Gly heptad repeat protein